jgi:ElaA protein
MIEWQWCKFEQLSVAELYAVLQVRQQVFVLEQACFYADLDGRDAQAWHLLGWQDKDGKRELAAYLRYFAPGVRFDEASFGRVLTAPAARGTGIGQALLGEAIRRADLLHPGQRFRIQAQQYLERFYTGFGFRPVGAQYVEDDILHIDMLRD